VYYLLSVYSPIVFLEHVLTISIDHGSQIATAKGPAGPNYEYLFRLEEALCEIGKSLWYTFELLVFVTLMRVMALGMHITTRVLNQKVGCTNIRLTLARLFRCDVEIYFSFNMMLQVVRMSTSLNLLMRFESSWEYMKMPSSYKIWNKRSCSKILRTKLSCLKVMMTRASTRIASC